MTDTNPKKITESFGADCLPSFNWKQVFPAIALQRTQASFDG
jgi:hypothetical protein